MKRTLLQTVEQIEAWLQEQDIKGTYIIKEDTRFTEQEKLGFIVDIEGDFKLKNNTHFIPVNFGVVSGYFSCSSRKLSTLEGCPVEVGDAFNCSEARLTSLVGGPQRVGGSYHCNKNNLTSLLGAPLSVKSFDCSNNQLESLENGPQEVRDSFRCSSNYLKTLQGAPQIIPGTFDCSYNDLPNLLGGPQTVGNGLETVSKNYQAYYNEITTLEGAPVYVGKQFDIAGNPLVDFENNIEYVGSNLQVDFIKRSVFEQSYFPCGITFQLPHKVQPWDIQDIVQEYKTIAPYENSQMILSKEQVAAIQTPHRERKALGEALISTNTGCESQPAFKI